MERADLILKNANVLTMDPGRPRAGLVAVRDGRIWLVGGEDLDDPPHDEVKLFGNGPHGSSFREGCIIGAGRPKSISGGGGTGARSVSALRRRKKRLQ